MEDMNDYDKQVENIEKRVAFLFKAEKYELTIKEAEKLLEYDPNNYKAICCITTSYFLMGKYETAAKIAQNLIENYPEESQANTLCGLVSLHNKEYEKADRYIKTAIELDSNNGHAYYAFVYYLKEIGGKENLYKAMELITKALEIDPNNEDFHICACEVYCSIGEYYKAKEEAEKALQLNPESGSTHLEYGFVLTHFGELEKGIEHFYEALKFEPNNVTARENINEAQEYINKPEKYYIYLERIFLNKVLKINNNSKGFLILAEIFIQNKRYKDALRVFRKYFYRNPTSVEEHISYAKLLYDEGALKEALRYFKMLKMEKMNNPIIDKYIEDISVEM